MRREPAGAHRDSGAQALSVVAGAVPPPRAVSSLRVDQPMARLSFQARAMAAARVRAGDPQQAAEVRGVQRGGAFRSLLERPMRSNGL